MTLSGEAGAGNATLLAARVEQLEKALQGYRDLLNTHDSAAHAKCNYFVIIYYIFLVLISWNFASIGNAIP